MIDIKEPMVSLINNALADGVPCLVGTATRDGTPQISPKESVARAAEIPYRAAAFRIHGRARIVKSGPARERAWELTVPIEREKDPDKTGMAILIDVDWVEELSGNILMRREKQKSDVSS